MDNMWKLLFCCAVVSIWRIAESQSIVFDDQEDTWVKKGDRAAIECKWEYTTDENTTGEVLTWKAPELGLSIMKIPKDTEDKFTYDNSPLPEERLSEGTDFGSSVKSAVLYVDDFRVTDPTVYACEVTVDRVQKSHQVKAFPYAEPDVYIIDVLTEVDLRPPTVVNSEPDENATVPATTAAPAEEPKIEVQCGYTGAYPMPSRIEFIIGESEVIVAEDTTEAQGDDDLYNGTASLKLEANTKYDGKYIECQVVLPTKPGETVDRSTNTSSQIQIFHPTTYVTTELSPSVVVEGGEVVVTCSADGNPRPSFQLSPAAGSANGDRFIIENVQQADAVQYGCVAIVVGEDGAEETSIQTYEKKQLTVHYMREPTLEPGNAAVILSQDELYTVTCNSNGNPVPNVQWMKDGKIVSYDSELRINSAEYSDEGKYICESTSGSELISEKTFKEVEIRVEGACEAEFVTVDVASSQVKEFHFRVNLECRVTGNPPCDVSIVPQASFTARGNFSKKNADTWSYGYNAMKKLTEPVSFFCVASNSAGNKVNISTTLDDTTGDVCCEEVTTGGLSTGAVIGIILLVLVVLIGIPVACYFVKKRKAQPKKKTPEDAEAPESEKEGLNKEASSEV